MVATVGSISIDLSTNAAKFADGFKANATTVEQQSARMAKGIAAVERNTAAMGATLKNFGSGLLAGAGIAALGSLSGILDRAKQAISEFDEIASNSRSAGLRSDTYQALSFAAKQANIDQESLNSSLDIFAKNSGLAERGTGALYSGLKNLNPALLQNIVNAKDQEERLKAVADAMMNTKDAAEQAALASVVFGKGGVEMARLLDQGSASIARMKQSAQEMGIIIPDDLLQKAGELDDKLDVLAKVLDVNISEAAVKAGPLVVKLAQSFADFAKELSTFAGNVEQFMNNESVANFFRLIAGDTSNPDLLGNKVAKAFDGMSAASHRSAAEISADIASVEQQIIDLQKLSQRGIGVGIQIDDAQANLKRLQDELVRTQRIAEAAANNASGAFDQLLKSMGDVGAAASNPLPTVHRYGGDPNKIELPQFSTQSNVNGSGVGVTSYGGAPDPGFGAGTQSNVNGSGVNVRSYGAPDPNTKATASYTQETADNVSTLDKNTKGYLKSLSGDIGGYSQQQSIAISRLSQVVGASMQQLNSYALAALVHNNDSGATGTGNTMFGDSFDSQYGSYISSWGVGKTTRPSVKFPTTSSDGNYNTSVNVQQPGNPITFNYTAAPGVSNETAKQQALDMYYAMTTAAARA
ncbi:hypothetical protein MesoLj113a_38440 [Mesorhizobium sp. 113-1-2]|uniref:methyl-accepting chemotaxis protein n=1 Tax=Mesorhizobium sp. 113-1-2 TaxID=2744515 RepID=UPI0019268A4F|nr:methyl-accepting chemotaxis protein [Mesorhizobium sp. 113-1-2]BCG72686.1 hypothetical protein MesoLj113a_38440 [Mesorhizobium sp. 113-1-2]